MDIKKQLKALLQEAEIYSTQGLIAEARAKYQDAYALVHRISNLKNKDSLLNAIDSKFQAISDTKEKVDKGLFVSQNSTLFLLSFTLGNIGL